MLKETQKKKTQNFSGPLKLGKGKIHTTIKMHEKKKGAPPELITDQTNKKASNAPTQHRCSTECLNRD
jgi:hypothetical protein